MKASEQIRFSDIQKPPNLLSLLRILLLLPFLYYSKAYIQQPDHLPYLLINLGIVVVAMFTDFLDGYLARKMGWKTPLGQYLDPVSDRIVTIGGLIVLYLYYGFPLWVLVFYILRDLTGILGGAILYLKHGILGRPNIWGKWGVGIVGIIVLWYLFLPHLSTRYPEDHLLRQPIILVSILLMILIAGLFEYARSYLPILFAPSKKPGKDELDI